MGNWIVILNLAATGYMTGLIWMVQVVHYPLFDAVEREHFAAFESRHQFRTSLVVVAPMLVELAAAIALLAVRPPGFPFSYAAAGLALVGVAWAVTFLMSVPAHTVLQSGYDESAHRWLVWTNWLRTLAWSGRLGLLCLGLSAMLRGVSSG